MRELGGAYVEVGGVHGQIRVVIGPGRWGPTSTTTPQPPSNRRRTPPVSSASSTGTIQADGPFGELPQLALRVACQGARADELRDRPSWPSHVLADQHVETERLPGFGATLARGDLATIRTTEPVAGSPPADEPLTAR